METLGGSEPASLHPKCTMEQEFSFTALVSDWGGWKGLCWDGVLNGSVF